MQKLLAILVLPVVLLLASLQVVLAEDATDSLNTDNSREGKLLNFFEKKQENREKIADKIKEKKVEIREKIATKTAEMREKFRSNVKERFGKVVEHLVKHEERLYKIAEKIQSRLDKAKEKGVDITTLQAALDSCNSQKPAIAAAITDASVKVEAIDTEGTNDGAIRAAQASIKGAKEKLVTYHKCLVGVVRDIGSFRREAAEL